jgi:hypothetical protein
MESVDDSISQIKNPSLREGVAIQKENLANYLKNDEDLSKAEKGAIHGGFLLFLITVKDGKISEERLGKELYNCINHYYRENFLDAERKISKNKYLQGLKGSAEQEKF